MQSATVSPLYEDYTGKNFFFNAEALFNTEGHIGEIIQLVELLDTDNSSIMKESTNIEITQIETEVKYTIRMYYDY